jgi:UDP-glucose 4-epimerase
MLHVDHPAPQMANIYQAVNIVGTQNLISLSRQTGVRRLVYFSTVKVYGVHSADPVSEDTRPSPRTFYAQTKLEGEQVVRSAQDLETVVLRLSAVYGPRLGGSWARMIKAIARGWFLPVGKLQNRRSLTYVEDLACAAQLAAEHPGAAGKTYNVVGHETVTMHEVLAAIYGALGKPLPSLRIPKGLALAGAFGLEKGLALVGKRSPLPVETIQQLVTDEVYSGDRLRKLGARFTPLDEGWRQSIRPLKIPTAQRG